MNVVLDEGPVSPSPSSWGYQDRPDTPTTRGGGRAFDAAFAKLLFSLVSDSDHRQRQHNYKSNS